MSLQTKCEKWIPEERGRRKDLKWSYLNKSRDDKVNDESVSRHYKRMELPRFGKRLDAGHMWEKGI